jgi:putative transposase
MAWENFKVEEQRLKLIKAYIHDNTSMTDLCKLYGVSRKTAYKWYERYLQFGEEGLKDQSTIPQNIHYHYTKAQIDKAIDLKLRHRKWGPKKILVKLKEKYPDEDWPSPTTLYDKFKELHLTTPRRLRNRVPATAPLGNLTDCNDTWSIDLKGWFLTGDDFRCEPLTIMDNFSRYLIRCTHLDRHSVSYVWPILDEAFREYGLPKKVRSDNGPPFGSTGSGRLTRLSINLIKAGVVPEWISPGHPEENGRHERFHLTLKNETASPPRRTLALQIQSLKDFQHEYNFERPHEALDMKAPGNIYTPSSRIWDGILRPPEYNMTEIEVRKVGQSGCIWFKGKEYYIGQMLTEEYVGLRNNHEELEVYYGPVYLGKLNLDKGLKKPTLTTRRPR